MGPVHAPIFPIRLQYVLEVACTHLMRTVFIFILVHRDLGNDLVSNDGNSSTGASTYTADAANAVPLLTQALPAMHYAGATFWPIREYF